MLFKSFRVSGAFEEFLVELIIGVREKLDGFTTTRDFRFRNTC